MRHAALAVFLLFATPLPGLAAPAPDRFAGMDTDKDNALSWEEFSSAIPGMKREAFDVIDANKDGRISRAEWEGFSKGHGSRMGSGPATGAPSGIPPAMPPAAAAGETGELPLLSPPVTAPAAPSTAAPAASVQQKTNDLPLLSPPAATPQRATPADPTPDLPLLEPPKP